jgi:pyruvate/2-oxoglutarate dehydrogenase complex dihydrolipoamide acyltransferase (E2) component
VSNGLGLVIESLVAVLLLLTISFCVVLNGRLKRLKADEHALKGTIAELITATEIAERAIAGLKMTVRDCDQSLGDRLRVGDAMVRELGVRIETGREVLGHLAQIALAARPAAEPAAPNTSAKTAPKTASKSAPKAPTPDAQATAQAASAFAARARQRLSQAA